MGPATGLPSGCVCPSGIPVRRLGIKGPLAGLYRHLAGVTVVDWLFMIGLAAVGTALVLGIGMRIAAAAGALLMVMMMWSAVLPPASKPFMDDHLIYALVLIGLALVGAGDSFGLGRWWRRHRTGPIPAHPEVTVTQVIPATRPDGGRMRSGESSWTRSSAT
jgi:uncharacterized membrane protein YphA (DoxX/SURF4 family)